MSESVFEVPEDAGEWEGDFQDIASRFDPGWAPNMHFGQGWYPLVCQANRQLRFISPDYRIYQIKEKFGTLRYYAEMSPIDAETSQEEYELRQGIFVAIIEQAENKSAFTCELCGKYGRLMVPSKGSWIRTLCPSCAAENDYIDSDKVNSVK